MMFLDWILNEDYSMLKDRDGERGEWRHFDDQTVGLYEPAEEGRESTEDRRKLD